MNVSFKNGEVVNGWTCVGRNGLSQYVMQDSEGNRLLFDTDAGEGKNYSKVLSFYNGRTERGYRAMRFLFKYISTVQGFSNALFQKYKEENWEKCPCGKYDCIEHKTGAYSYLKERD
jgi:hypothetical protein